MTRRGDSLSFIRGRRRRDFYDRRSVLPSSNVVLAVIMLASMALAVFGFLRSNGTGESTSAMPPVVYEPVTTSTTLAIEAGTSFLECPQDGADGWTTFQGAMTRSGCTTTTRTITDPEVLWQTELAVFGWLNNPIVANGRVYVGSAGNLQSSGDGADGVYAIDLQTGNEIWHFEAENDVNGVAYADNVVVATGDEGRVWGIIATGADQGRALWTVDIGISVFTNPLIIEGLAIVGDWNGEVTALDLATGERRWRMAVAGPVRGGVSSDGTWIFVVSEEGGAAAVTLDGTVIWRQDLVGDAGTAIRVFAAPTVANNLLLVPYVRDDLYSQPAMMALDKQSGQVRWRAVDASGLKEDWGNIRSSPALIGTLMVFGEVYSNGLYAMDVASGETRWSVDVGPFCNPHWPSPAIANGTVYLARHDGGLYAIDAGRGDLAWSIYVGDETDGRWPDSYEDDNYCEWNPKDGSPVLASPAIAPNGVVVVGSIQGLLTAVGDSGWDG